VNRGISYSPAFYKIFDEILVNAADNKVRDKSMSYLKVEINAEKQFISVENDGRGKSKQKKKQQKKMKVNRFIFVNKPSHSDCSIKT
jgi:DNA gyrase/topoisomerase IV subunit B